MHESQDDAHGGGADVAGRDDVDRPPGGGGARRFERTRFDGGLGPASSRRCISAVPCASAKRTCGGCGRRASQSCRLSSAAARSQVIAPGRSRSPADHPEREMPKPDAPTAAPENPDDAPAPATGWVNFRGRSCGTRPQRDRAAAFCGYRRLRQGARVLGESAPLGPISGLAPTRFNARSASWPPRGSSAASGGADRARIVPGHRR